MKKLLYLFAVSAALGCESESNGEQTCVNKLWNLTETCNTEPDPETGEINCNRLATYGPSQANATTFSVNEATYDFYIAKGNVTNGSICWEGTK